MDPTSSEADFIENMAQEQCRYETIFGEQAEVLRADPPKFEAAMAQIQQSPLVAKGGQPWEPTQDNVDEYLAYCDDICRLVPQDFEELSTLQRLLRFQFTSDTFWHIQSRQNLACSSCSSHVPRNLQDCTATRPGPVGDLEEA